MKLCKIDEQGYFVEDVIVKVYPTISESYTEEIEVTIVDEDTGEETLGTELVDKTRQVRDPLFRSEKPTGGLHLPRFNFTTEEWGEGRATLSYDKTNVNVEKFLEELGLTAEHKVTQNDTEFQIRLEGVLQDVNGDFEKKVKVKEMQMFTEYEEQEVPLMETVPKLDANGEEQYDDNEELIIEEVQATETVPKLDVDGNEQYVDGELVTEEVPKTELVQVPVEVPKEVEVTKFEPFDKTTIQTQIETALESHEKVDLVELKEEQVTKLKQDTHAYIINGFTTDVKYNEPRHYSLSEIDQMNINSMMGQLQAGEITKALWSDDSSITHDIWTASEFLEFYRQANTHILMARLKSDIVEGKIVRATTEGGITSHSFSDELTSTEKAEVEALANEMLGVTV